jgi:hypothetical protein
MTINDFLTADFLQFAWPLIPITGVVFYDLGKYALQAATEARFAIFKARVRRIWTREIFNEDIIHETGETCWWEDFTAGKTPREAVYVFDTY